MKSLKGCVVRSIGGRLNQDAFMNTIVMLWLCIFSLECYPAILLTIVGISVYGYVIVIQDDVLAPEVIAKLRLVQGMR